MKVRSGGNTGILIQDQKNNNMEAKKEAKKYLDKYFKEQYINEKDDEFKALVRLLNSTTDTANCGNTKLATVFYNQYWQLCPKCNGDGDLFRYNSPSIMATNARPICDVCNGKKIISTVTGLPPG